MNQGEQLLIRVLEETITKEYPGSANAAKAIALARQGVMFRHKAGLAFADLGSRT